MIDLHFLLPLKLLLLFVVFAYYNVIVDHAVLTFQGKRGSKAVIDKVYNDLN